MLHFVRKNKDKAWLITIIILGLIVAAVLWQAGVYDYDPRPSDQEPFRYDLF